jgi:hypothetical protein
MGEISRADYDYADTMKRSELSNIALCVQSVGEIVILAIIARILWGVKVNDSTHKNNWELSILIAIATGVWLLLAIPWFIKEKRRPGQKVPPGMNIITIGLWQLRQSLIYLIGYIFPLSKVYSGILSSSSGISSLETLSILQ